MNDLVEYVGPKYLSCAETAKLIRKALAKAFPGYKFSVRSNTYSGGASIDVGWVDGPPASVVDAVVSGFAGGRFDGMIDMAYSVESWLNPDGTAYVAHNPGTQGSMGMDPGFIDDPRSPDAQLVHFGADYVFTNRSLTPEAKAVIDGRFVRKFGDVKADEGGWSQWNIDVERRTLESRALFAPCEFTYSVERSEGDGTYLTEATGLTHAEAVKTAKALEKARNPRGFRYIRTNRKAGR